MVNSSSAITKKKYSASLRLWHWLNTIVISGSLLTVLLNATILKKKPNAVFIQDKLKQAGAIIDDKQAKSLANDLTDKVWDIHVYFGYVLVGLFVFRILLELFQVTDQKLLRKIKSAYNYFFVVKKDIKNARHEFLVKSLYAFFYLLILTMAITGLSMVFEDDIAILKTFHKGIKQVHNFTMYIILGFIVIHLAGVFLAEMKQDKGIVSDMINGGETKE